MHKVMRQKRKASYESVDNSYDDVLPENASKKRSYTISRDEAPGSDESYEGRDQVRQKETEMWKRSRKLLNARSKCFGLLIKKMQGQIIAEHRRSNQIVGRLVGKPD